MDGLDHYQFLQSLAEEYYTHCEAFDLQVCTGKNKYGEAMPNNYTELSIVNKNARAVLRELYARAGDANGFKQALKNVSRRM